MRRRDFLASAALAGLVPGALKGRLFAEEGEHAQHGQGEVDEICCATYPSPEEAMKAPREPLVYIPALYRGTGINRPDYLATVDVDPDSGTYGQVIHRLEMPNVGDELHHFGWNACSSCHADPTKMRRFLVVPGMASGRIHIIDTADPWEPKMHKVIEGRESARKTNLSAPHTVHCRADGIIMISMLGDAKGQGPGGFLELNQDFEIVGRWEKNTQGMDYNYDFWYQPRHNVMVSSEWAAPNTFDAGFKPEDVEAGKYGRKIHFWDWEKKVIGQTADLGEEGLIPLEVRFHHNPDSPHGFVGAALSSAIWHWTRRNGQWKVEKVVQVEPVQLEGKEAPLPGLITDILLSLDDRWLYFSNWLHGDIRQYDVSNPSQPKLTGQVWLGGKLGKSQEVQGKKPVGGPQMLQLSLDGKRLYVTSSLYSSWDNQFYPEIAKQGSFMLQVDCDTNRGGMQVNEKSYVDFGQEPNGPARAHEMHFPGGDVTSDIWV